MHSFKKKHSFHGIYVSCRNICDQAGIFKMCHHVTYVQRHSNVGVKTNKYPRGVYLMS